MRTLAWEWLTLRLMIGSLRRVVSAISPSTAGLLVPLDWASQFAWGLRAYRRGRTRR